jgi:hypothetical protein
MILAAEIRPYLNRGWGCKNFTKTNQRQRWVGKMMEMFPLVLFSECCGFPVKKVSVFEDAGLKLEHQGTSDI